MMCRNDDLLSSYLPDKEDLNEISRDFLLTVSHLYYNCLFLVKEKNYGMN